MWKLQERGLGTEQERKVANNTVQTCQTHTVTEEIKRRHTREDTQKKTHKRKHTRENTQEKTL